jgi:hypothetical protein
MTLRLLAACLAAGIPFAAERIPSGRDLVAHEWGTFTSVADLKGDPTPWLALGGPQPLPCFVHAQGLCIKCDFTTVRMETPVIYFYTQRKTALSIGVGFPGGRFTEWYPRTEQMTGNRIQWRVETLPDGPAVFPQGEQPNHYYEARATDSVPLRAGVEEEKLIFYRGVGDLPIPVRPRVTSTGRIELRNAGTVPVPSVIVFENRDGKLGFRAVGDLRETVEVDAPKLSADAGAVQAELHRVLVSAGLYAKEAAAMLATWRDSWFEEGTRVFYVAPLAMVDAGLPMTIEPAPASVDRVFVGRIEVLTPAAQKEIAVSAARRDGTALAKYGRFLQAFWQEMRRNGLVNGIPDPRMATPNPAPCTK